MKVLFTDLDGTCVHYTDDPSAEGPWGQVAAQPDSAGLLPCTSPDGSRTTLLLRLPPSASGAQGLISLPTLRLYAALRALGVKLVVITGARLSTLLGRLPCIPAADAYVCEGGGRIFYPASPADLPTAAPLVEDLAWRQVQAEAAGPAGQDGVPPERRSGALWACYARLAGAAQASGLRLDAASYTTAFRVKGEAGAVAAALRDLPSGLATALNLGAADVFPATSGKENAARHLMQHFGAEPAECNFMCDDDNDLGLAALVRKAYLPGITAQSVAAAVAAAPHRFHVASSRGPFGAEEVLRLLVAEQMAESQSKPAEDGRQTAALAVV
ncbi:hypothetical protein ABPG77_006926 [Micractinium sp. CCAP 211/92]